MRIVPRAWGASLLVLVVVALVLGSGRAQSPDLSFVPVADLVEPLDRGVGYLNPAPLRGRRLVFGEHQWLGQEYSQEEGQPLRQDIAPWIDDGALGNLLAQLLSRDAEALQMVGKRHLLVRDGTAAVVTSALAELRQRLPPVVMCDLTLVQTDPGGERILLQQVLAAPSGRRSWASLVTETTALARFEVEIAQGSQIANPIVDRIGHGAMVMVRPFVLGSEPEAWFELLVRVVDDANLPAIATGQTSCGAFDRVGQNIAECGTVVHARLGDRIVQRWRGPADQQFELRLTPTWQVRPPTRVAGHELEYVPCWTDFRGFRSIAWRELETSMDEPTPVQAEFRAAVDAANVATMDLGTLWAMLACDAGVAPMRALVQQHQAAHKPVALRVAVVEVAAGATATDGADARILGSVELQTVTDTWSCATAYEEQSILVDWDCEVAQSSRIPVPRAARLSTGLFVDVRTDGQDVEIAGELSWHDPVAVREIALNQAIDIPGSVRAHRSGDSVSVTDQGPVHLPQDLVKVETAAAHRVPLRARLPLRKDAPVVWRTGGALLAPGRQLLLTVQRLE